MVRPQPKFLRLQLPIFFTSLNKLSSVLLLLPCIVWSLYKSRKIIHVTPYFVFQAYKKLYLYTRGYSEIVFRFLFPPWNCDNATPFRDLELVHSSLSEIGFSRFTFDDVRLVSEFLNSAQSLPFRGRCDRDIVSFKDLSTNLASLIGRYDAISSDLFANAGFARIVTCDNIREFALSALGKDAVITSALVWASFPTANFAQRSLSAQVYHVDFDFIDDIKVFILLSDSSVLDGPLEYIPKTHKPWHHKIFTLSEIDETSISSRFDKSRFMYFTGEVGDSYVSNNRGIHRDCPPAKDHFKIEMQINLARSRFGDEHHILKRRPVLSVKYPSYGIWAQALDASPMLYSMLFSR